MMAKELEREMNYPGISGLGADLDNEAVHMELTMQQEWIKMAKEQLASQPQ